MQNIASNLPSRASASQQEQPVPPLCVSAAIRPKSTGNRQPSSRTFANAGARSITKQSGTRKPGVTAASYHNVIDVDQHSVYYRKYYAAKKMEPRQTLHLSTGETVQTTGTSSTMQRDMKLPAIIVSEADRDRLVSVATAELRNVRPMHAASMLLGELGRASVVGEGSMPEGVVTLDSDVEIRDNVKKSVRRIRLICPGEASQVREAVSVLTPLGAALIGLSEGDSIHWSTATGSLQHVTVLRVLPKAGA